jgi:predicted RNA binding protein YcfA (HicA-like mRNA interferase family)
MSGREICRLLALHGFQEVRQRGNHLVMQKAGDDTTITVPVPLHDTVHIGTLQSIIRQSGLPRNLFEDK